MKNTLNERSKNTLAPVIGRYMNLNLSHGKGCYLYDDNNNAYLDFASGIAVNSTGHCHPDVVTAIKNQAKILIHPCIAIGNTPSTIECAEAITQLLPEPYRIFFTQSGSESVETALKCAKYVTKRKRIIAFEGGFHGRTYGALSVTSSKKSYWDGYKPLLEGVDFFPYPNSYRCPWNKTTEKESIEAGIHALETSPLFNDQVAGVIIEPILGEGGYIPAPIAFLEALYKQCQKHGILFICDEIQTGIGRTGSWFAFEKTSFAPDIITTAKGLGSGMPIGACLAKKEIMDQWPAGAHGGTYGANPVTCAAALATLQIIEKELPTIPQRSHDANQYLNSQLNDHPHIGDIRIEGLMIGVELVKDKNTKTPFSDIIPTIINECLQKKLIVIACGVHQNVIRIIPPLITDSETLLKGLSIFCEVIHDHCKG